MPRFIWPKQSYGDIGRRGRPGPTPCSDSAAHTCATGLCGGQRPFDRSWYFQSLHFAEDFAALLPDNEGKRMKYFGYGVRWDILSWDSVTLLIRAEFGSSIR